MKVRSIMVSSLAIAMLALPAVSFASTYQFIDMSGNLQSVEADTATMALATAYQLGTHSGVMLTDKKSNYSPSNSGSSNYYQFINTSGNMQGLWATNPSIALATAYQLGTHSGVMLAN